MKSFQKTPSVTVLMPVHNGERFLSDAVASVLRQTYDDFELLIVDDASTDSSARIADSFNDPRVRLITGQGRLRFAGALNLGLELARGRYVARMDADDICRPERLAVQTAFLDSRPEIGMCGAWVRTFGSGKRLVHEFPVGNGHIKAYALFDNPFSHPTIMVRRNLLDKFALRFIDEYYPTEDFEIWTRAVRCFSCENIGQVLLDYRVHPASMSVAGWTEMDAQALRVVERELRLFGLEPTKDEVRFHRSIGRGRSRQCRDMEELGRAETWLLHLAQVNDRTGDIARQAFQDVVSLVWYRVCFNSARLGTKVWRRYAKSPLYKRGREGVVRMSLLAASIARQTVLRAPGISQ